MNIDPIVVEAQLQVLAVNFSNSYFTCVAEQYQTVFKNSSVIDEMDALDELSIKRPKDCKQQSLRKTMRYNSQFLIAILAYNSVPNPYRCKTIFAEV